MIFFLKNKIFKFNNLFINYELIWGYLNCLNLCNIKIFDNLKKIDIFNYCYYKTKSFFITLDMRRDMHNDNFEFFNLIRPLNSKILKNLVKTCNIYYIKLYEKYKNKYILDHNFINNFKFRNFKNYYIEKLNSIKYYKLIIINFKNKNLFTKYYNFFNLLYNFFFLIIINF